MQVHDRSLFVATRARVHHILLPIKLLATARCVGSLGFFVKLPDLDEDVGLRGPTPQTPNLLQFMPSSHLPFLAMELPTNTKPVRVDTEFLRLAAR